MGLWGVVGEHQTWVVERGELLGLLVPQVRGKGCFWGSLVGLLGLAGIQLGLGVAEEKGRVLGGFSGSFYSVFPSWWYQPCSMWNRIPWLVPRA